VRTSPLDERLHWHEGLLAQAHYIKGNYEETMEWVREAIERNQTARASISGHSSRRAWRLVESTKRWASARRVA